MKRDTLNEIFRKHIKTMALVEDRTYQPVYDKDAIVNEILDMLNPPTIVDVASEQANNNFKNYLHEHFWK